MAYVDKNLRERPLTRTENEELREFVNRELVPMNLELRRETNRLGGNKRAVSATGDILRTDRVLYVDASAGAVTLTLPPAADVDEHAFLIFKTDSSANEVTVVSQTGETISGTVSRVLSSQYQPLEVLSDSANYWVTCGLNDGRIGSTLEIFADYAVTAGVQCIIADATAGNLTVTLRNAATAQSYGAQYLQVKKIDASANTVTITGTGDDTVEQAATAVLASQFESIELWPRPGNYDIK